MSFNVNDKGCPIVIIKDKGNEYNGTKIYISDSIKDDNKLNKGFDKLQLKTGQFQIIPNTKKERDVGLICGASGSGKSYFIKQYIKEYKKTFKKNNIYMFSNLDYDETLDDDLKIDRVKIDEELLTDPLSVEDFENSLVIFDDIDVIRQKELKNAVYQIMDEILETGRHLRVSCLMTVHYPTGNQLKRILNECMFYVYFPWGATRANNYVLENYLGVDKLDIKKIKATKSRWAVIFKNYPQAVITEKAIWMLANNED